MSETTILNAAMALQGCSVMLTDIEDEPTFEMLVGIARVLRTQAEAIEQVAADMLTGAEHD